MARVFVLAALGAVLGMGAPAATARGSLERLYVSPGGSLGSACTRSTPCRTLDRANQLARPGQIVELAGGTYPAQDLTFVSGRSGPHVVFQPSAGARVRFAGRLTIDGASRLTLRRLRLHSDSSDVDDRALVVDACSRDVRLEDVTGDTFFIMEGTRGIVFRRGSWGGYSRAGKEDSAVGTSGATGPTRSCNGKPAPPARGIVFDGVTFHDVFWGRSTAQWGSSHPDCFEINGYVDGLRIQNSTFVRCAGTFMQINGDQGDILRVSFVRNLYYRLGRESWYGIQITSEGKPGKCGSLVFRGNTYLPATKHPLTWPNSPIRTDCETVPGTKPVLVTRNLFARGPDENSCREYRSPGMTVWSDNLFVDGSSCGSGPSDIPYGYTRAGARLRIAVGRARVVRFVFRAAAGGRSMAWIISRLGSGWTSERVRTVLANRTYFGAYGEPGSAPALVPRRTWRAAQRLVRR